ncbi:hypothetical protein GQ53DRAFT_546589 [Thozetella sp. PMI_491]|nr:hypothetical protein GQ53DRAFT_546589 [Thozetella sp. PMI_491]
MEATSDSLTDNGHSSIVNSPLPSVSTHDITPAACHIRNFSKIVEALNLAADRASGSGLSRYTSVHVLLLRWEYEDLGVDEEVQKLSEVFRLSYGFEVENWRIPSSKPVLKLTQTISHWVEKYDDEHNLFIFYYAGHGRIDDGRQILWRNVRDLNHEQFAEIKWSGCEDVLHEAASDTLFLLDCCHAAGSASRPLRGYSETIAASGFDSIAPPPGPHSFTASLTSVLRRWASSSTAFSVVKLHTELLVSLKEIPPPVYR